MKKRILKVLKLTVISSLGASLSVQAVPLPEIDCLIEPNKTIELSSQVSGVLNDVLVDRSDSIKKGQVIATLKSDVEQVKVKSSHEKVKLSRAEYKRAVALYEDHVITLSEKEIAYNQLQLYKYELQQAKAVLEQRKIRSPIDAVVVDRYRMPGEYVDDNPVLKIAQLDPLRVEIIAAAEQFGQIKKGMHAHVEIESAGYPSTVAEVALVDKVIDAASGTFGVRLELPNKEKKIPGGLKCKIAFFNNDEERNYANKQTVDSLNTLPGLSKISKLDQ